MVAQRVRTETRAEAAPVEMKKEVAGGAEVDSEPGIPSGLRARSGNAAEVDSTFSKAGWGMSDTVETKAAVAVLGARAIFSPGRRDKMLIEFLPDRMQMEGGEACQRKALSAWLKDCGVPALESMLKEGNIRRGSQEIVTFECPNFAIKGSPMGSDDYLHVAAWMKAGPGLDSLDVAEWSGKVPPPVIGAEVGIRVNQLGKGVVVGEFSEEGYRGVKVLLEGAPEWFLKQQKEKGDLPIASLFGVDLVALGDGVSKSVVAPPSTRYLIAVNSVGGQIPNPGEIRDVDMHGRDSRWLGNIQIKLVERPEDYLAVTDPQYSHGVYLIHKDELAARAESQQGIFKPWEERNCEERRQPRVVHRMEDYLGQWKPYKESGAD